MSPYTNYKKMGKGKYYSPDNFSYKDSELVCSVLSQLSGDEKEMAIQFYEMLFNQEKEITIEPNPFNL